MCYGPLKHRREKRANFVCGLLAIAAISEDGRLGDGRSTLFSRFSFAVVSELISRCPLIPEHDNIAKKGLRGIPKIILASLWGIQIRCPNWRGEGVMEKRT